MKKALVFLLAAAMVFCLAGCAVDAEKEPTGGDTVYPVDENGYPLPDTVIINGTSLKMTSMASPKGTATLADTVSLTRSDDGRYTILLPRFTLHMRWRLQTDSRVAVVKQEEVTVPIAEEKVTDGGCPVFDGFTVKTEAEELVFLWYPFDNEAEIAYRLTVRLYAAEPTKPGEQTARLTVTAIEGNAAVAKEQNTANSLFSVPLAGIGDVAVGDELIVTHNGEILETFPMQFGKIFAVKHISHYAK